MAGSMIVAGWIGTFPAAFAGSMPYPSYLVNDGNPGVGEAYDRLPASWSEDLSFPQFNIAGQQLDSVSISYSLFVEIAQTVQNKSTTGSPVTFSLNNTLSGGLSLGGTSLIDIAGGSQLNTALVPKKSAITMWTHTFAPFDLSDSAMITLTGADLLPFLGSGNVLLTTFATASTTQLIAPASNFNIDTTADGNAKVTVTYNYSPVPPPPHVPDGGSSLPMMAFSMAALVSLARAQRKEPITTGLNG